MTIGMGEKDSILECLGCEIARLVEFQAVDLESEPLNDVDFSSPLALVFFVPLEAAINAEERPALSAVERSH
jgi:hypothetical protein